MQHGFSATYSAWNSTIFETTDVNQCSSGGRHENFQIAVQGILQVPKTQSWGACAESTVQMPHV